MNSPKEMLNNLGLKSTASRVGILDVLRSAEHPLSEEQIAGKIKNGKINKTTIYRNLDRFVEAGIVHKAYLNERKWHYELSHNCTEKQCHPHFTCVSCGETHCFVGVDIPLVAEREGFLIKHQRVHLDGVCPACAVS